MALPPPLLSSQEDPRPRGTASRGRADNQQVHQGASPLLESPRQAGSRARPADPWEAYTAEWPGGSASGGTPGRGRVNDGRGGRENTSSV